MSNPVTKQRKIDDVAAEILEILDRPDLEDPMRMIAQLIAQARDAGESGLRYEYLEQAQQRMRRVDPRQHARDLRYLQGQVLALQGRGGDTRIAHVTPGEYVLPDWAQTPEMMGHLAQLAHGAGVDPNALRVGSPRGHVNPGTGHQEFDVAEEIIIPGKKITPNINDPEPNVPTYDSLAFDPKGRGQWGVALRHPLAAYRGNDASNQAQRETVERYPEPRWNNSADAYRHARWNQLMAQSVGPELAKQFGDAHEISEPNGDSERLMDLYNNKIGRGLLTGGPEQVEAALKRGLLRTSPFFKK